MTGENTSAETVLFAEDGAWEKLVLAQETLVKLVEQQLNLPGRVPVYPAFDAYDTHNLLLSHCGLKGEFLNGPDGVLGLYRSNILPLNDTVKKFLEEFDRPGSSQLSGLHGHQFGNKLPRDVSTESSHQAMTRCADEVEKWLAVNAEVPETVRQDITATLAEYRAHLSEVVEFVAVARGEGRSGSNAKGTVRG